MLEKQPVEARRILIAGPDRMEIDYSVPPHRAIAGTMTVSIRAFQAWVEKNIDPECGIEDFMLGFLNSPGSYTGPVSDFLSGKTYVPITSVSATLIFHHLIHLN